MKLFLIVIYIAAILYFFVHVKENRYGKALSFRQKAVGMAVTFFVITVALVPALWGRPGRWPLPVGFCNHIFYFLMAMLSGLWLLITFKPALYPRIRLPLIRFFLLLIFALILWPFIFSR